MATQTVSHVVSQSKSATLSIPKQIPQQITQIELVLLLSLRGRLSQLEEQVAEKERSANSETPAWSAQVHAGVRPQFVRVLLRGCR